MRLLGIIIIPFLAVVVWMSRSWWIPILSISPQHTINVNNVLESETGEARAEYEGRVLAVPSLPMITEPSTRVLGEETSQKRIEVDLTNQRLLAFENNQLKYSFLISSGKWGRTPTGRFRIWVKLRATKMEGGSKALRTYYYLPNVPYVMYFYNEDIPKWRGYGLHGTYWHSNFGHPMSHGCINMKTEEAEQLYYWVQPNLKGGKSVYADEENPGTEIFIYGQAPLG